MDSKIVDWLNGEIGRWGDGEIGEMGRWGDGEMGRWGDWGDWGKRKLYSSRQGS
ncbi:MAG: hypothetical protein F6K26_19045 [Moorea sp. SIO2I5]|nr:hypothetical protein [Moorena sp. SIO2I5]